MRAEQSLRGVEGGRCQLPPVHGQVPAFPLRQSLAAVFAVYGPFEDTSRLIPTLLRNAVSGNLPPFVDARTSRDFIHVDDVCAAFVAAATAMRPALYGESFNIGTGVKTTIAELLQRQTTAHFCHRRGTEEKFGTMEGRAWDLARLVRRPSQSEARRLPLAGNSADWARGQGFLRPRTGCVSSPDHGDWRPPPRKTRTCAGAACRRSSPATRTSRRFP